MTRWAHLPPLAQQIERLGRQHDVAVLAALRLLDTNDLLGAVDMLDLQPHHLAGTQAAAIAEARPRSAALARTNWIAAFRSYAYLHPDWRKTALRGHLSE